MNNTHPIELFIVLILDMVEGLCWIINEITGGHTTTNHEPATRSTASIAASIYSLPGAAQAFTSPNNQWIEYVEQLTVKQLQELVGTRNSRYRKADLIQMAIAY